MAEKKQDDAVYGQFRGWALADSVSFGWSRDKTSRHVQIMLRLANGREIEWRGNLTDQTGRDITIQSLLTMGWDGESPIAPEPGHEDSFLLGLGGNDHPILISINPHTYNGKTFPQVDRIDPPNGRAPAGGYMTPEEMAKLNEDIRRHRGATAPRKPQAARPAIVNRPAQSVDPRRPATEPVRGPEPVSPAAVMGAIMSDEDRLRAIDRGHEGPPRPTETEEDDLTF